MATEQHPAWPGDVFSVAQALNQGWTRREVRTRTLARPRWGVRSERCDQGDTLTGSAAVLAEARALATVLPEGAALSHTTAAILHGFPLEREVLEHGGLHVCVPLGQAVVRREGVVSHRLPRNVRPIQRVPVTDVLQTWADLAGLIPRDELIVCGDWLLRPRSVLALPDLQREVQRRDGARGVVDLREALIEVRCGSASRPETLSRLLLTRAGLPEPELNVNIFDDDGQWLAVGDLVWRRQRVVGEYDGDHHRTSRTRWQEEIRRRRSIEEAGWRHVPITSDDIFRTPHRTVQLFRRALGE